MIFRGNKRLIRSDRAPGGNSGLHPSVVKMLEGKREQFQLIRFVAESTSEPRCDDHPLDSQTVVGAVARCPA